MHNWGDETFDWNGLDEAIDFIHTNLVRWGRIGVRQSKEKFGCARIYCSFGFNQLFSITHPGYAYSRYPQWLWNWDCVWGSRIIPWLFNWWVVPYHKWLYRKVYELACKKWAHLTTEICCDADFRELLTFWRKSESKT